MNQSHRFSNVLYILTLSHLSEVVSKTDNWALEEKTLVGSFLCFYF